MLRTVPSLLAGPTSVASFIFFIYLSFSACGKFSSEILLILLTASSLAFAKFFFSSSATTLSKRAFVASRLASVSG